MCSSCLLRRTRLGEKQRSSPPSAPLQFVRPTGFPAIIPSLGLSSAVSGTARMLVIPPQPTGGLAWLDDVHKSSQGSVDSDPWRSERLRLGPSNETKTSALQQSSISSRKSLKIVSNGCPFSGIPELSTERRPGQETSLNFKSQLSYHRTWSAWYRPASDLILWLDPHIDQRPATPLYYHLEDQDKKWPSFAS